MTFVIILHLLCAIATGAGSFFFTDLPRWYRAVLGVVALIQIMFVMMSLMFGA